MYICSHDPYDVQPSAEVARPGCPDKKLDDMLRSLTRAGIHARALERQVSTLRTVVMTFVIR